MMKHQCEHPFTDDDLRALGAPLGANEEFMPDPQRGGFGTIVKRRGYYMRLPELGETGVTILEKAD